MKTVERRFGVNPHGVSIRSSVGNSPGNLRGYAAVFNSYSEDLGGFRERIAPGAFTKPLQNRVDVKALFNHDPNYVLGRTANGTLRLSQDYTGLACDCDLPDTSYARDLYHSIQRGDINQMSFAFQADDEDWDEDEDPEDRSKRIPIRTIRAANLLDVSFVTNPAYSATSASVGLNNTPIITHSLRDYFPQGLPAEVRSRLGAAVLNPRGQEARRKLFNLFVG